MSRETNDVCVFVRENGTMYAVGPIQSITVNGVECAPNHSGEWNLPPCDGGFAMSFRFTRGMP